jgi:hypothetical protein
VRVRFEDGPAPAGLLVVALGEEGAAEVAATTDAEGVARLRVPSRGTGRVVLRRGGGDVAAAAVPAAGDAPAREPVLHATRRRHLWVHVRRGGAPFLPRPFRLLVDDVPAEVREVQPDAAFVAAVFDPPGSAARSRLVFAPTAGEPVAVLLPAENGDTGAHVIVDLDAAGPPLEVVVLRPPTFEPHLLLYRWEEREGRWTFDRSLGQVPAGRSEERVRVEGLPAGRYQVLESTVSVRSEPAEVVAHGPPCLVRLDLSRAGWVRGRIDLPAGEDVWATKVWVWDGPTTDGHARATHGTGATFEIAIPGDRPVTFEARHATLFPDGAAGRITVTHPQDGVILRLGHGPSAHVRLARPDGTDLPPDTPVGVFRIKPGERSYASYRTSEGGRLRIGGFAPGTYRLVLDDSTHAPLTIDGAVLGAGETDLGERRFERGYVVRLRARVSPGKQAPPFTAFAEPLDERGLHRTARHDPRTGATTISGLAAGRYRVRFHSGRGDLPPATGVEQDVVVGPGIDAEATIDFTSDPMGVPASGAR